MMFFSRIIPFAALFFFAVPAAAQHSQHIIDRLSIVSMQAQQIGFHCIVRYGDSISEEMGTPAYQGTGGCDLVINAGLMGATTSDIATDLTGVIGTTEPRILLLQAGTNDAVASYGLNTPTWLAAWAAQYEAIIAQADAAGIKVLFKTIPPVAPGTAYDHTQIDAMNVLIRGMAPRHPADKLLDLDVYFRCPTGYGVLTTGMFADGVHLGVWGAWMVYWLEQSSLTTGVLPPASRSC